MSDTAIADAAKDEAKDDDDEFLNPLDMDVDDDEDLLVGCLHPSHMSICPDS